MSMKKQKRINDAMRLCSDSFRTDKNSVRINTHNTLEHETAKLKLVYQLIQQDKLVYTEVIFNNGARADVFVPEDFRVFEVLHSESREEFLSKKDYYPFQLDLMAFSSEDILNENFEI